MEYSIIFTFYNDIGWKLRGIVLVEQGMLATYAKENILH